MTTALEAIKLTEQASFEHFNVIGVNIGPINIALVASSKFKNIRAMHPVLYIRSAHGNKVREK
jgi:hypothetical protein